MGLQYPNGTYDIIVASLCIPPTTSKYAPTKDEDILDNMYKGALAMGLRSNVSKFNVVQAADFNANIGNLTYCEDRS